MNRGLVGMAADDDFAPRGFGHDVEFPEIVHDVHPHLVNLEGLGLGEAASPRLPINVTSHGPDRRH
jgi:hypothetical protein